MSIKVVRPFLPPKKKLFSLFNDIYKRNELTNNGKYVRELEDKLQNRFNIKNVILVANGTIGLQIAIRALGVTGEVITSPFSFIATTSSILWEKAKPIYADIDIDTYNINPREVSKKVSSKTSAILPVHVFGNPCDIENINKIAKKRNLKVIYDASHCFDINFKNRSIFEFGDCSVASFHATKVFHTIEGGAIFTNNSQIANKIRSIINFGMKNKIITDIGTNAKMNEFEAAMGLSIFDSAQKAKNKRKLLYANYKNALKNSFQLQKWDQFTNNNFSYFPIVFKLKKNLKKTLKVLNENNIFPRRYFYPSLNQLKFHDLPQTCKNSKYIADRILCLPLYYDLKISDQRKIINLILSIFN